MEVSTDYQSSTEAMQGYGSLQGIPEAHSQEGKLGGCTICTQPQDRKTLKIINRVKKNVQGAKDVSQEPEALENAGVSVKEQLSRTRSRNGLTPVSKEIAPESSAIAALRERLLQ